MRRDQVCPSAVTPAGPRRFLSLGLAAVAALAGWMLLAPPALADEPDAAATTPPPGPAFYTVAISRLKIVEPDTFEISRGNLKAITVHLADATCEGIDKTKREQAMALVTQFLEGEPFWVFPCGLEKEGTNVWRALVWTKKGWLSEVLVKALLATRRPDPFEGAAVPADKTTYDRLPPGPCEPAFQGVVRQMVDGNTLEVLRDGRTIKVRLFDVGCEGSAEDAKSLATKLVGTDPVWIFPSSQRRLAAGEAMPVRVWTKEGWLSQAMVKGGLAKVFPDPDKTDAAPAATVAAKTDPTPAAKPPKAAPAPKTTTNTQGFVWREVPVGMGTSKDNLQCESAVFKVTSQEWRLTWTAPPVRAGAAVILTIYRVDSQWQSKISSTVAAGFTAASGQQIIHSPPGDYWIRCTQSTKLNAKVECQEPVEKGK